MQITKDGVKILANIADAEKGSNLIMIHEEWCQNNPLAERQIIFPKL